MHAGDSRDLGPRPPSLSTSLFAFFLLRSPPTRPAPPDIVSFYSHGRAFGVHDMERFIEEVMPKYFKQSKWNSFARQLNLYGFMRLASGPDSGGYYHEVRCFKHEKQCGG